MNASPAYDTAQGSTSTIEVDSAPGGDTHVEFDVPVRGTVAEAGRDDLSHAGQKRSLRILCIDDDPQVLEFMNACLMHFDHRVMVASGGKQGLEMFRSATTENQPFDVIITDLGMPVINGHQVARTIKAEFPSMPVIMMTGWGATVSDDGDNAPGVDVVVSKPPCMKELNDLLLRMATPANRAGKEEG